MTRKEMWKEFEKQLIRETRTPITVSYGVSEEMTKSAIERTVAKWKDRLEQKPKTGHWVHGEYCSECGCDVPAYIIDWKWKKDMNAKYCPNCGAKMEVKKTREEMKK